MEEKESLEIAIFNRIHEWATSLYSAQAALDLCIYLNQQLFSEERCVPHDLAIHSHQISFDFPALYYMRVFNTGYGLEGKMSKNNDEKINSIREKMITYVRTEMRWSEDKWIEFQNSISNLRNQTIAHFDASAVHFQEDGGGYAYPHPLMKPKGREDLGAVIKLMRQFLSNFIAAED